MGTLNYNGHVNLSIDDRALAHLQVVVVAKLRRRETFAFTWNDGGQETVCWINPSIALEFIYSGNRQAQLNREWLEMMSMSANTNAGLMVMPEPQPNTAIDDHRQTDSPLKQRQTTRPKRSTPTTRPARRLVSA